MVENNSPFAAEAVYLSDENGRPVIVPIVKATYRIGRGGTLALSEEQPRVCLAGEYWGPAGESSYKFEPEIALTKLATDVVLLGSAVAPQRSFSRELDVSFRVGKQEKTIHVIGNRQWVKRIGGGIGMTTPEPFERIPLTYEHAFGGWDRSNEDPERHTCEGRNPVGTGFRQRRSRFEDGVALPNLEDPAGRIKSWGDSPRPAGVGFVGPNWEPRATFAGTYDTAWMRTRMPLLPKDFDKRFFNAASPGLVMPGFLEGGETVVARHVSEDGEFAFRLPRVPPPEWCVAVNGREDQTSVTRLDTVVVNSDDLRLHLLWRGEAPALGDPSSVNGIRITVEGVPLVSQ